MSDEENDKKNAPEEVEAEKNEEGGESKKDEEVEEKKDKYADLNTEENRTECNNNKEN